MRSSEKKLRDKRLGVPWFQGAGGKVSSAEHVQLLALMLHMDVCGKTQLMLAGDIARLHAAAELLDGLRGQSYMIARAHLGHTQPSWVVLYSVRFCAVLRKQFRQTIAFKKKLQCVEAQRRLAGKLPYVAPKLRLGHSSRENLRKARPLREETMAPFS